MAHSGQSNRNLEHELPKDIPTPAVAPPPYTPGRQGRLANYQPLLSTRGISLSQLAQRLSQDSATIELSRSISTQVLTDNEIDDEDNEPIAPLCLRINTSINVSKSNNLICLSETPATHATAIAEAVTQAIQKHSSGNCGFPMIDGNGNPRPIRIEVDAGMVVEGQGNIIGNEDVLLKVLRQREEMRQREGTLRRPRSGDEEGESSNSAKRRRSE